MLGRGIGDESFGVDTRSVPVELIDPSPFQPRLEISEEELTELANSIKQHGLLQPIVVRRKGRRFEVIAGERRLRAAKLAGLQRVPVVVKDVDDRDAAVLALVENLQRKDLNFWERAMAIKRLHDDVGLTEEEIGRLLGVSKSHVSNYLRVFSLPPDIIEKLKEAEGLTLKHIKALLRLKDSPGWLKEFTDRIVSESISARKLEELVEAALGSGGSKKVEKIPTVREPVSEDVAKLKRTIRKIFPYPFRVKRVKSGWSITLIFPNEEDVQRFFSSVDGDWFEDNRD